MKKIEDYLHLYLGCEVQLNGVGVGILLYVPWFMNNRFKNAYCRVSINEIESTVPTTDIRPILRPLSGMTEDEMKQLLIKNYAPNEDIFLASVSGFKFYVDEPKRNVKRGDGVGYSTFNKDGWHFSSGTLSFRCWNQEQFLYLLWQHFDLFGLIEAGLAIDKTTIK